MHKRRQGRLAPDDWASAALRVIGRDGLGAVAVESIAAELGTTKGSFYWHFSSRDALIRAALDRWEQLWTEAVIARLEREADPAKRLKMVIAAGFESGPSDRVEIALIANPDHPAAVRAVRRVAERRIAYMTEQLRSLGWRTEEAYDRAVLLYYVYVGYLQMARAPLQLVTNKARERQMELVLDILVSTELPIASTHAGRASDVEPAPLRP
jgi:AcrR family transcriptional regulator